MESKKQAVKQFILIEFTIVPSSLDYKKIHKLATTLRECDLGIKGILLTDSQQVNCYILLLFSAIQNLFEVVRLVTKVMGFNS